MGTLSSNFCPPRPGVTPATTLVPYAMQARAWSEPNSPVMPWKTTLLSLLTRMLISLLRSTHRGHHQLRSLAHRGGRLDRQPALLEDLLARVDVRPLEPHHERHLEAELLRGGDD